MLANQQNEANENLRNRVEQRLKKSPGKSSDWSRRGNRSSVIRFRRRRRNDRKRRTVSVRINNLHFSGFFLLILPERFLYYGKDVFSAVFGRRKCPDFGSQYHGVYFLRRERTVKKSKGVVLGAAALCVGMFGVAGPIIVSGVCSSVAVGIIYYIAGTFA